MKTKEEFNKIIDALYESNNDGEMTIYVLLRILVAYMNGDEFTDNEVNIQWKVIHSIFNDYNIQDINHVIEKMDECIMLKNGINLKKINPLGGIH